MRGRPRLSTTTAALRAAVFALCATLTVLALGCGDDDGPTEPGPNAPADTFIVASTPALTAQRLFQSYAAQDAAAYGGTLTQDFRYYFSTQADPDLVTEYGNTWDIERELDSATHLFAGFTDGQGFYQEGAQSITIEPFLPAVEGDPSHADSTRYYARVRIIPLLLDITLDDDRGFDISTPVHLYVVRGDAAVLGGEQAPDSTLWYVRRVDDLAEPISLSPSSWKPARPATWGAVRAQYLARRALVHE